MVFAILWHESAMDLHVFPIPIPAPASLPIGSLWVFPVYQPWPLVGKTQRECSTLTASPFRIWNSSTGILSLSPALFVVLVLKAYLTSHSKMSVGDWYTIVVIQVIKIFFFVDFFCVFLPPLFNIFCFCYVHTISPFIVPILHETYAWEL